jgi:ligand-binding sensor domain-containing protein
MVRARLVLIAAVLSMSRPLAAAELLSSGAARFVRLSTQHGLSQDTVTCILQDHRRFLWFGTEEGLNRYDGYAFQVFKHQAQDPRSLPSNFIMSLFEDHEHRLWVATLGGLSLFDEATDSFRTFRSPASADAVFEDRRGNIWVGSGGLHRFDPARGEVVASYQHSDAPDSLSHNEVRRIMEDRSGRIWVATARGLNLFDPDTAKFTPYLHSAEDSSLSDDFVWDVAEDREGRLWVATYGGGLDRLDPVQGRFHHYRKSEGRIPSDKITAAFVDQAGTIWAGSDGAGLLRYDPAHDSFVSLRSSAQDSYSLSTNVVRSLHEDLQGGLWVGTYRGGVNLLQRRLRDFSFYAYDPARPDGLSEAMSVETFLEDRDGSLWIGTSEGGLNRLDRGTGRFRHYRNEPGHPQSLAGDTVLALFQDSAGQVWAGMHGSGLDRFDPKAGAFVHYRHDAARAESLASDVVWAIAENPKGTLWLATDDGLDEMDAATGRFRHHPLAEQGTLANSVRTLLLLPGGDLWIGSLGGLYILANGQSALVRLRHDAADPESISANAVAALHRDLRGRVWVGTLGGGLDLVDPRTRKFTAFGMAEGLPSDGVNCVCDDARGNVWLGTNNGLARFNPETREIKNFGVANGLRTLQFNLGACHRTRDERLLFGSSGGFYFFDPETIKADLYVPPVVFTGFRLFDQPVHLAPSITTTSEIPLTYRQNMVSLEFAALDFGVPRGNSYAYRVEGFRPEWSQLGAKHELTFTNLAPGTYTVQVRASNSDGVWNETPAELRLVVTPPLWATTGFRALLAGAFVAGVLLLIRLHRRRLAEARRHVHASCTECRRAAPQAEPTRP